MRREIGWSQKDIILYEILKQLDFLIKVTASNNTPVPTPLTWGNTVEVLGSTTLTFND